MSDDRQTIPSGAVDQSTRSGQAEQDTTVSTEDDIVADLHRQVRDLEERDRRLEQERDAERRRAATERTRAEAAEARARAADQRANVEAETGRRSTENSQLDAINAALNAREGQMNALEQQHSSAFTEGDAAKMAKAQREMALLGGQIAQLQAGKQALEARTQTRDTAQSQQQQPSADEQREAFVRAQPPLVQDWLRNNPNYFTDAGFREEVVAIAQYATKRKGLQPDSREYIDFVNAELGIGQSRDRETPSREDNNADNRTQPSGRDVSQNTNQQTQPPRQDNTSRRMVAAPAGGSVPGARSGGGDQVYLSAAEKAFVATLRDHEGKPVSEVEYAREKLALQRENEIGPNATRSR